jgi:hypothetical protein
MPFPVTGFSIEPPPGFRTQDMTVSFVTGLPDTGPSPSLIVQSRPAVPGATLDEVAAQTLGELLQTIPGMAQGTKGSITFDDGGKGILLSYTMRTGKGELRQYFVLRLEKGRICTATLTAPVDGLTEAVGQALIKCLKSIRPEG